MGHISSTTCSTAKRTPCHINCYTDGPMDQSKKAIDLPASENSVVPRDSDAESKTKHVQLVEHLPISLPKSLGPDREV